MNELSFALEKTKKFNDLILKDKDLSQLFVFGQYNFLQLYNPLIFLDFRNHYKKVNNTQKTNGGVRQPKISILFFGLLAIILSFLALIWFRLKGTKNIIFSNDVCNSEFKGDFRLTKIYRFLHDQKTQFGEIFFSANDSRILKNTVNRKRLVFYSQIIDIFYKIFSNKEVYKKNFPVALEDSELMNRILEIYLKKIPMTKFRIKFFEFVFKFLKIKLILTIDSVRRYGEMVAAAKNLNIKVFAFQHGQFAKYQIGWLDMTGFKNNVIKPDKLFVWANYWKNELLRLNTYYKNDEIDLCENSKSDIPQTVFKNLDNQKNILMLFETDAPKDLAKQYIKKITQCSGIKLLFKIRPDRDLEKQLRDYGLNNKMNDIDIISNLEENIEKINIVLGFQSTLLYEMIVRGKIVGILESDLDYTEGLINSGFAEEISLDGICEKLELLSKKNNNVLLSQSNEFVGKDIKTIDNILKPYV